MKKQLIKSHNDIVCTNCNGRGFVEQRLRNNGSCDYELHIFHCSACKCRGFLTKEDIKEHYDGWCLDR